MQSGERHNSLVQPEREIAGEAFFIGLNMSTKELYDSLFYYRDGNLYWRSGGKGKKQWKTKPVGTSKNGAYRLATINGEVHQVHRIIFTMFHGFCPDIIDHINCNPNDCRIENLRPATQKQNGENKKIAVNNKSGVKGVYWNSQRKKWYCHLKVNGKTKHLGVFYNLNDAKEFIEIEREKLHGEFCNHG